jgi:MYXO-CTERM domain-containing protein
MKNGFVAVSAALIVFGTTVAQAQVVYSQTWDGTGDAYASQNDDVNGYGNFATVYDDFTFGSSPEFFNTVSWIGSYFNPSAAGTITGFTIDFYNDSGSGTPGALDYSDFVTGNADETYLGTDQYGDPDYSYSANVGDLVATGYGPFWISIVPDLSFPPQWGWDTSSQGNGNAYQVFEGNGSTLSGVNMAFTLSQSSTSSTPGPAAIAPFAMGLLGVLRRRRSAK